MGSQHAQSRQEIEEFLKDIKLIKESFQNGRPVFLKKRHHLQPAFYHPRISKSIQYHINEVGLKMKTDQSQPCQVVQSPRNTDKFKSTVISQNQSNEAGVQDLKVDTLESDLKMEMDIITTDTVVRTITNKSTMVNIEIDNNGNDKQEISIESIKVNNSLNQQRKEENEISTTPLMVESPDISCLPSSPCSNTNVDRLDDFPSRLFSNFDSFNDDDESISPALHNFSKIQEGIQSESDVDLNEISNFLEKDISLFHSQDISDSEED
ncbi:hypothetical protein BC833DRAFT_587832 [Globomyces pollinis-pini]|nr:hypothetical protein BC833DRAFT_587832 [Globomyces pollinis-pini]